MVCIRDMPRTEGEASMQSARSGCSEWNEVNARKLVYLLFGEYISPTSLVR